jgi:hypothetical protein
MVGDGDCVKSIGRFCDPNRACGRACGREPKSSMGSSGCGDGVCVKSIGRFRDPNRSCGRACGRVYLTIVFSFCIFHCIALFYFLEE